MAYKRITTTKSRRPQRMRMGLGAYSDLPAQGPSGSCGPDQKYDPAFVFMPGMAPGQCVNESQYNAYHGSSAGSSSSSGGSFWSDLAAGFSNALKPTGTPAAPVVVQGGGGLGTVGTLAIVGGAGLLLYVLLK